MIDKEQRAKAAAKAGVPRHVAIIMDGNGRWAQSRGLPRAVGHRMGVEAVRRASSTRRQQVILFQEDRCELMDESGELVRTVKLPTSGKLELQQYYAKDLDDAAGQSLRVLPGCLLLPCRLVLTASGGSYEFVLDPLTGGYRPE